MIYLQNANYINWKTLEITNTDIQIEADNDEIHFFPANSYLKKELESSTELIDCKGKLLTKSFACGHHHIYSALSRGMPAPKKNPANFQEILKYVWWNLDKKLDAEMIRASALASAVSCLKNGITFVIDHHSSPNAISGSLEIIEKAFQELGLSHLLCYELSDRDGKKSTEEGLEETDSFLASGGQGLVGLHASFTVGDELLNGAVELASKFDSGIHVHTAEDSSDQEITKEKYGNSVVQRFSNTGVLDFSKSILAHCIHLDDSERELLKKSQATIVQNPESNLNNNVGYFHSKRLGSNIMLGTDGMHSDMIRSAQAAFFSGQAVEGVSALSAYTRLRNTHHYLQKNNFTGDAENNLVLFDYPSPTPIHSSNFLGHFLFGLQSSHVDTVISSGKIIVKDAKLLTANEEDIFAHAKQMAEKLWSKL